MTRVTYALASGFLLLAFLSHVPAAAVDIDSTAHKRAVELVSQMTLDEKLSYIGGDESDFGLRAIPRLGIPAIRMSDGPQGVNDKNAETILYPCGIALASTWNKELAYRYGASLGGDARARGIHIMLGPGVNIYRSPLCGRNFEYFGEDPFLASETAVEYIKGMQDTGVMATVKHFCGNNSEWSRHNSSSDIDERTLQEIYFPAFRKAVQEAGVGAVMSSYNLVNSIHTTESPYLAKTILRDTWGFEGIFMSDWAATYSGVAAANAGLDLEMPNAMYMNAECLKAAIANGIVREEEIDLKCVHILQTLIAFGFLDREQKDESIPLYNPKSVETALEVAREAHVLLKNDGNILPLSGKTRKIAVLGPNADVVEAGGGSGFARPSSSVSPLEGFRRTAPWLKIVPAEEADAIIYCCGFGHETELEGSDRPFGLPENQLSQIHALDTLGIPIIAVVNAGGGVEFKKFIDCTDAVIMAWYPGQCGGLALAEIVTGRTNPSGRLPISIEASLEDNPTYGSYYANEVKQLQSPYDRIRYREGIFTGYRGYGRNGKAPLYPFGFGLSYTTFEFSALSCTLDKETRTVDVRFKVRNTGKHDGATIAQVYVGETHAYVPRPEKELKGYEKVFLKAGETKELCIRLDDEAFSHFDTGSGSWKTDKGEYRISVGESSADLPLTSYICYPGYRWELDANGAICWKPSYSGAACDVPHSDHVEMTGEQVSAVLYWGVESDGKFMLNRRMVFPLLRKYPDDTHASLVMDVPDSFTGNLLVDGQKLSDEKTCHVSIDGKLYVSSTFPCGITLECTILPSASEPALYERYRLTNSSGKPVSVSMLPYHHERKTSAHEDRDGKVYSVSAHCDGIVSALLEDGQELTFDACIYGVEEGSMPDLKGFGQELEERERFKSEDIEGALVLETPCEEINAEFRYAKLRASESIIATKGGLMHNPGGEVFYSAIWTNDQCEYINPFFGYLGYAKGKDSAMNSYRHFARFMNKEYNPIPSSIIAQGLDIWNGAGDRGDAAMIAYGASRFAMESGDIDTARELWPLIEWCLEYCNSRLTLEGIVASDSDELENRFPSGPANLSTSCLYLDALRSSIALGRELAKAGATGQRYVCGFDRDMNPLNPMFADSGAADFPYSVPSASYLRGLESRRKALAEAIEKHFGARLGNFETYRYYEGNTLLRSWICLPLIAGLGQYSDISGKPFNRERIDGTVAALTDSRLLTGEGLLTQERDSTWWDRSTLYAIRGIFNAGHADKAAEMLRHFSGRRLLSEHVPYPVEAYPEGSGSMRHLSAESGLYCLAVIEGLFGIRPCGLSSFELTPSLPSAWKKISLGHIKAFGKDFSIQVEDTGDTYGITLSSTEGLKSSYSIKKGKTLKINL